MFKEKQYISNINNYLRRLTEIMDWVDGQSETDTPEVQEKAEEALDLLKSTKKELKSIKKELKEIINEDDEDEDEDGEEEGDDDEEEEKDDEDEEGEEKD